MDNIQNENTYMTRMANDLLLLARLDNQKTKLEMIPLDLSEIVRDVVKDLDHLQKDRKSTWRSVKYRQLLSKAIVKPYFKWSVI